MEWLKFIMNVNILYWLWLPFAKNLLPTFNVDEFNNKGTYELTTYRTSTFTEAVIETKQFTGTKIKAYILLRVMSVKADWNTPSYGGEIGIVFKMKDITDK